MNQIKIKKDFDCIAYKSKIQANIYEEIKNLSPEEQIIYFRRRAESSSLGKWWKTIKKSTTACLSS